VKRIEHSGFEEKVINNSNGHVEHIDGMEYLWTPEGLYVDDLYTLRIVTRDVGSSYWAISPPWKAEEEKVPLLPCLAFPDL
jgi:hypothetical protein